MSTPRLAPAARKGTRGARVRRPEATRAAIVQAGLRLFSEKGFDAIAIREIVDEAELTKGAFYHHFLNKEDLLLHLLNSFLDYQLERVEDILARDLDPQGALHAYLKELLFEVLVTFQYEIKVFMQEQRFLAEESFATIREKRDRLDRYATEIVERGVASGSLRNVGPARLTAFAMIGMGSWAALWLDPKGVMSPGEIADMYADILLHGLAR
jgi:AcrR family transcriptional regulator